jgi:ribosomal protein L11 methyltransferase
MARVTELQVEVFAESREVAEGFLYLQGADELVVEDESTGAGEGRPPIPEGKVRLIAFFAEAPGPHFEAEAQSFAGAEVRRREVDPDEHRDRWKEFFKPAQVSPRLWVKPSWEELPRPLSAGERAIVIDPGAAFGTGLHETTRLCLNQLDRLCGPGVSVLDVGTGSGILAIGAGLLGAGPLVATDNDPIAVSVAQENVDLNGLVADLSEAPLDRVPGTYAVVVANILAATLTTLRRLLWEKVAPGGALILAGLLVRELDYVTEAFLDAGGAGCVCEARESLGEWGCLVFRRLGAA